MNNQTNIASQFKIKTSTINENGSIINKYKRKFYNLIRQIQKKTENYFKIIIIIHNKQSQCVMMILYHR